MAGKKEEEKKFSPRVQKKREKKRNRILDVALDLVEEKGLEGLSIHEIARSMDYTAGALYRYFSSKDALIVQLQIRGLEHFKEAWARGRREVEGQMEREGVDSETRTRVHLLLASDFYRELARQSPAYFRFISLLLGDPRPLVQDEEARPTLEITMELLREIASLVERSGLKNSPPSSSMEKALVFWASQQGILQIHKLGRFSTGDLSSSQLSRLATVTLLRGWGGDEKKLEKARQRADKFKEEMPLATFFNLQCSVK